MKVKQLPSDFRVEEVNRLEPGVEGRFALYRLEKHGIGTPEAVRLVRRAWRLAPERVAFAGLKDRYGTTGQVISVRDGPRRNHSGRTFSINYLGQSPEPAARGTILANRFRIVVRDLAGREAERFAERARDAALHGFPNYYDDQRFGSLRGTGGRFVAEALLAGDAEEALRLAIASPDRADRSRIRKRRDLLRRRWGEWDELARLLDDSLEKGICHFLARGGGFAGAYGKLDPALRSLHLGALQAALFNEGLRAQVRSGPRHPGVAGPYRFYEGDPGDLAGGSLPLASAEAPPHPLLDAALAARGLTREALARLPFRPGRRDAVVVPEALGVSGTAPDEANPGRRRLDLEFALPPGSYATMLLKRCSYDIRGSSSDRPA